MLTQQVSVLPASQRSLSGEERETEPESQRSLPGKEMETDWVGRKSKGCGLEKKSKQGPIAGAKF